MKRVAQEGMARMEDLPSNVNINETKRSLGVTVKADMKKAMNIIGDAMEDLLDGIENIFIDYSNLNGSDSERTNTSTNLFRFWKFRMIFDQYGKSFHYKILYQQMNFQ